jgi:hypothetical protein
MIAASCLVLEDAGCGERGVAWVVLRPGVHHAVATGCLRDEAGILWLAGRTMDECIELFYLLLLWRAWCCCMWKPALVAHAHGQPVRPNTRQTSPHLSRFLRGT